MGPQFSRPDHRGVKRVLMCRVLVGESSIGTNGQLVPDASSHASQRLCDTTVDDVSDPTIFVTCE